MSDQVKSDDDGIVIKKYANRRLYNTASSSYVTLEDLSAMVKAGEEFVVRDAKSGEDITRSVLTQIIFEEEAKGQNLLPINFLRQLIGFYGGSMQAVVPSYLDHAMGVFAQGQEEMQEQVTSAFGSTDVMKMGEDMAKQNMAMFQQAMSSMTGIGGVGGMGAMFTPPTGDASQGAKPTDDERAKAPTKQSAKQSAKQAGKSDDDFDALKEQLSAMQRQLDALAKK